MPSARPMTRSLAFLLLLAALVLAAMAWRHLQPATGDSPAGAVPEVLQGQAKVFDADTLGVQGQRLRLIGVDAPEYAQTCGTSDHEWPCGREAIAALRKQIDGRELSCRPEGTDRYRRPLVRCTLNDGEDLNRWLVRNG